MTSTSERVVIVGAGQASGRAAHGIALRSRVEAIAPHSIKRLVDGAVRLKDLLAEATCSASTP